jgi:hypothetical protein
VIRAVAGCVVHRARPPSPADRRATIPARRPQASLRSGTAAPGRASADKFRPQWICDGCALLALAAISVPIVTATHRVPAVPLALESLTALFGLLGVLLVLIRVLNLPGDADGRDIGLWLGLVATLGIPAGGLIAMRDERRSPQGRHTDLSGVPVSTPREVETVSPPEPGAGT